MRKNKGFTLIEAMITVAIVAILSAVAYPSYVEHVRKSHRADAQSFLMQVATRQQQTLLDTRGYAATLTAMNLTAPTSVSQNYTVAIAVGTSVVPTFTVTATPTAKQAQDKCGVLTVDQTGAKSPANCW
jgi:type IV pilus assembly protein PilE